MREVSRLVFQRSKSGRVLLSESPANTLKKYIQVQMHDSEAGGMLLGRLILESNDLVVDEATEPNKRDRRSRFFFWRSKKDAQKRIDDAWARTNQTRVYLGEWHTHPEDDPTPSCIDLKNWRRIVREARFEQESLLFLIAGRERIRLWELGKGEKAPIQLVPLPE